MILPSDLADAVKWMGSKWGHDRLGKAWDNPDAHLEEFRVFSPGSLKETLRNYYRAGNARAPSPPELWKLTSEAHIRRVERGVEAVDRDCLGSHVWAHPYPTDRDRHQVCVLCGELGPYVKCEHVHNPRTGVCFYCPDQVEPDPEPPAVESEPV